MNSEGSYYYLIVRTVQAATFDTHVHALKPKSHRQMGRQTPLQPTLATTLKDVEAGRQGKQLRTAAQIPAYRETV